MKNRLFFLRLCGLLLFSFFALAAEAKECAGSIYVFLQHPDGSLVGLEADDDSSTYMPEWYVTLATGDTIVFWQFITGECWGVQGSLRVRGTPLGETADETSPVVNAFGGPVRPRTSASVHARAIDK